MLDAVVNPKSLAVVALLILIPYLFFRQSQSRNVSFFREAVLCYKVNVSKADVAFAREHNCLPLVRLKIKWPLGLDLLWAAYQHAQAARILRFFVEITEGLPPTFEQRLLGTSGIDTSDPLNIESVLATQFTGRFPLSTYLVIYSQLLFSVWAGRSSSSLLPLAWPRYLHSRRRELETLPRAPPTTFPWQTS